MAASSSDAELSQLLAALVSEFPGIVTDATPINGPRPGVFASLACTHNHPGCRSEQVQLAPSKGRHNQIDCVSALKELLTSKHAPCIAEILATRDAELAEAARQEQLLSFGTMMAAQKKKQSDERHAAALKLAKEQLKLAVQQSNAAQKKAAEARTAEELAAEPFVAATRTAEAEAATLEAQAVAAKAALDELQTDQKRGATAAGGAWRQKGRPHAGHTRSAGRGAPPPAATYPGDGVGDPGGRGRRGRGAKGVLVNSVHGILACLGVT
jgi:hypothetical protein